MFSNLTCTVSRGTRTIGLGNVLKIKKWIEHLGFYRMPALTDPMIQKLILCFLLTARRGWARHRSRACLQHRQRRRKACW